MSFDEIKIDSKAAAIAAIPEFHRNALEYMLSGDCFNIRPVAFALPSSSGSLEGMAIMLSAEYRALKTIDSMTFSSLSEIVRTNIPGLIKILTGIDGLKVPKADPSLESTGIATE